MRTPTLKYRTRLRKFLETEAATNMLLPLERNVADFISQQGRPYEETAEKFGVPPWKLRSITSKLRNAMHQAEQWALRDKERARHMRALPSLTPDKIKLVNYLTPKTAALLRSASIRTAAHLITHRNHHPPKPIWRIGQAAWEEIDAFLVLIGAIVQPITIKPGDQITIVDDTRVQLRMPQADGGFTVKVESDAALNAIPALAPFLAKLSGLKYEFGTVGNGDMVATFR